MPKVVSSSYWQFGKLTQKLKRLLFNVDRVSDNQYKLNGVSYPGKSFSFTFREGTSSGVVSNDEITWEENETYIEWCQLSQTI